MTPTDYKKLAEDAESLASEGRFPADIAVLRAMIRKLAGAVLDLCEENEGAKHDIERQLQAIVEYEAENQRLRTALGDAPCDCPYGSIADYEHKPNCFIYAAREALERK